MTRDEQIKQYAMSFKGKDMENEELKEIIRLAIIDGATWADANPVQPSLPSNLDEAAEEYLKHHKLETASIRKLSMYRSLAFKAGAEWMARQYEKIEGEFVDWYSTSDGKNYCCGIKTDESFEVPEDFYIKKK